MRSSNLSIQSCQQSTKMLLDYIETKVKMQGENAWRFFTSTFLKCKPNARPKLNIFLQRPKRIKTPSDHRALYTFAGSRVGIHLFSS